ncbi:hypothetical protein [Salana multivorans]
MSGPTSTAPADATPAPSDQVRPFRRIGLLRLTWPLLVVTLLTLLAALGNVVILSAASPELNAAVATANQILGVLYDISVLFSIGGLVVISQLLGAGLLGRLAGPLGRPCERAPCSGWGSVWPWRWVGQSSCSRSTLLRRS